MLFLLGIMSFSYLLGSSVGKYWVSNYTSGESFVFICLTFWSLFSTLLIGPVMLTYMVMWMLTLGMVYVLGELIYPLWIMIPSNKL
jgi:hypothetical protein